MSPPSPITSSNSNGARWRRGGGDKILGCKFPNVRNKITETIIGSASQETDIKDFWTGKTIKGEGWSVWDRTMHRKITAKYILNHPEEYELTPCQRCTECRLDYSRQWATRCMCESMTSTQSWFLTLTYDEEHVPGINKRTGELFHGFGMYEVHDGEFEQVMTLEPSDMKTFTQSLNKKMYRKGKKGIRYYYCGEYGGTTFRPHYHMIAFNLELEEPEMEFMFVNKEHQPIYKCQWIENLWGKGQVRIGAVTWNSAAYVARYIMKKQTGKEGEKRKEIIGNIPEFTRSSNKPGIGKEYFDLNKEQIYKLDKIILPGKKARTVRPAKYYDKLYDIEEPEKMDSIKKARQENMRLAQLLKLSKTTLDLWEQLKAEHEAKQDAYNKLIRPLE